MALFPNPLEALLGLQRSLDANRASDWLEAGPSGGGAYPPMNVFRRGDDFAILAEVPGIKKSELEVQVKGRTVRLAGTKAATYPEQAGLHRRERLSGRFDRAVSLPVEINADAVQAEYRDGILAVLLPRAAHDKPKAIQVK